LCFESFAADLLALMDHLHVERAVVGGISMGAAVALHVALHHPARVLGLVLSRPAWLEGPMERNAQTYALIARLIREHGPAAGKELFVATPTYAQVLAESPDAAASLVGQFEAPGARETVARLERIPRDAPCRQLAEVATISVPTLILANRQDPIHPFAYGEALARRIRGAELTRSDTQVGLQGAPRARCGALPR
jgi:pimeloyl-ACP methyl ester carboxylesterase